MKKRRYLSLALIWISSILISLVLPLIGSRIGKAGDCKPGEVDGQCGLGTFVGFAYGACGGVVIAACVTVYVAFALYQIRKRRLA